MPKESDTRTVAEIREAQMHAATGGCCDRFADMSPCSCLRDAQEREFRVTSTWWRTPSQGEIIARQVQPRTDDLGPLPQVHPRHYLVTKAAGEFDTFVAAWWDRHGLTPSEALSIVSREVTRSLETCVRSERKA